MSIASPPLKNGNSRKKRKVNEILHLSSACIVNPLKEGIDVILYDLMGNREGLTKHFEDFSRTLAYLEFRRVRISNNYQWRKRTELRDKRMKLDYSIRQMREGF